MVSKTLAVTTALISMSMAGAAFAECEITLRSADNHPEGYPTVEAVEYMGQLLQERSDGRICIEVFHSAQLGQEADVIEQTQFGVIDMARLSMGSFNTVVEETQVVSLPYIFRSIEHMHTVMDGPIGDEIAAAFSKADLVGLAFYDSGSRSFYNSQRPINSIEDIEGLSFRVMGSDIFVAMVEALGGDATPMPFGEVYSALQTGVIDGAENNWPSFDSTGHYEVAPHYTLDQHLIVPEVVVISQITYDSLSAEDQELVRQAARDSVPHMRELWAAYEAESEARMVEAGVEIVYDIDKTPFIEAMAPVYEQFVTSDTLRDLVERIQATE